MNRKDKFYIFTHLISCFLAIGLVLAGTLLCHYKNFNFGILCIMVVVTYLLCIIKGIQKRTGRIIVSIFTVLTILLCALGIYCNPYWNSISLRSNVNWYSKELDAELTQEEALEDLEYAMHYLDKLHPAFYKDIPEVVQERYEQILAKLEEKETITVCELNQNIEYIFAVLRDGHSYVKYNVEEPHYMKDIYQFNQADYSLVAINDIELQELLKQKKDFYSYEVESWQLYLLKNDISCMEGLQYLGIDVIAGVKYTYESADGVREERMYFPEDFIIYDEYVKYNNIVQDANEEDSFVSYKIDKENDVAILTLTSCINNEEYKTCVKDMFIKVKELGIQNVAVDIRSNGGGDSRVTDEFIRYLDVSEYKSAGLEWRLGWLKIPFGGNMLTNNKDTQLTFYGNVYVLTSANSFSSAMLFAEYIGGNNLGTIIGEAPGNTPNGYGEVASFKLPNSQLYMSLSTKEFFRVDHTSVSELVEPDIPCNSDDAVTVLYETIGK